MPKRVLLPGALTLACLVTACAPDIVYPEPPDLDLAPGVIFDMYHEGGRNLYRVALDGSELTRLTSPGADNLQPTASPTRVLFSSLRHSLQAGQIYEVSYLGGMPRRVRASSADESQPAISRDGSRLAYVSRHVDDLKVWIADGYGKESRRVSGDDSRALEISPDWSPDNRKLAYIRLERARGTLIIHDTHSGQDETVLASDEWTYLEPSWSPDGSRIALLGSRNQKGSDLFVLDVNTGDLQRLTTGRMISSPTWPASDKIAYAERSGLNTSRLVWIDPGDPETIHVIPVPGAQPENPVAIPAVELATSRGLATEVEDTVP